MMSLFEVRREYDGPELNEQSVSADPIVQFREWLDDALGADLEEPTAMALATADSSGRPSARMVLLKSVDEHGFVFFTNYESRKGEELAENPRAALLFYWDRLHRQVRVEGAVERVSREETQAYFSTRPRESQLGAWISPQSRVLDDRSEIEVRLAEAFSRFSAEGEIEAPPFWGGYRVVPDVLEFWQGRKSRLHDRLRYTREATGWRVDRLAP